MADPSPNPNRDVGLRAVDRGRVEGPQLVLSGVRVRARVRVGARARARARARFTVRV